MKETEVRDPDRQRERERESTRERERGKVLTILTARQHKELH